jgi:nitrogen fixation-related uncharacterized protein
MRKWMIVCGVVLLASIGLVTLFWGSIVESYEDMLAVAGEVAEETGLEMGRVSYHAMRCGNSDLMNEMQTTVDQLDQSSDFQASMRDAFYLGVEEAKSWEVEYTEEFCAELARQIEAAQNN